MLNNSTLQLEVKPENKGKIYFGGTDAGSNFVFINLSNDQMEKIPATDGSHRTFDAAEAGAMADSILTADKTIETEVKGLVPTTGSSTAKTMIQQGHFGLRLFFEGDEPPVFASAW